MKDLKDLVNARCFFVVGFTDGLMYAEIRDDYDYKVTVGGRKDRGIEGDVEPVFHFPVSDFNHVY